MNTSKISRISLLASQENFEAMHDEVDEGNYGEHEPTTGIMNLLKREQKISFKKLLVPMSMRSSYWKYFGFPSEDGKTLTSRDVIVCAICKSVLNYNKNTTNLKTHLKAKHKEVFKKPWMKLEQETVHAFLKSEDDLEDVSTKCEEELEPGEILEDDNKKFIIIEQSGDEIIEKSVEVKMDQDCDIQETDTEYNMFKIVPDVEQIIITPSPTTNSSLDNLIIDMLITDLLPITFAEGQGFKNLIETLTNSAIPSKSKLEKKLAETFANCKLNLAQQIQTELKYKYFSLSLDKWSNISGNTFVTLTMNLIEPETQVEMNNVTIKVALSKINRKHLTIDVVCFTEGEIIYYDLLQQHNLDITKCIAIVANYRDPNLVIFSEAYEIPIIPCFMAIIKNSVEKFINNSELSTYFTNTRSDWTLKWAALNEVDDFEIQAVSTCLAPLRVIYDLLNSDTDSIPNSSMIKPIMNQLIDNNYFTVDADTDSLLIKQIKADIKSEIESYLLDAPFLNISAFLDPRFTNILTLNESSTARQLIRQKLTMVDGASKTSIKRVQVNRVDSRSGLDYFFSSPRQSSNLDKLEQEFEKFLVEESSSFDKCPIAWWAEGGYIYPNLAKVATKYTTVPACIWEKFPVGSEGSIAYHEKRYLLDYCPQKMIFLYLNENREK